MRCMAFNLLHFLLEFVRLDDFLNDSPGPVQVAFSWVFGESDDFSLESAFFEFVCDVGFIVDLVEAERDDVGLDLFNDFVHVVFRAEVGLVDDFEFFDEAESDVLWGDRLVFELADGRVRGHDHDEGVAEFFSFFEEEDVTHVKEVEGAGGHYFDHDLHASMISLPSR